MCGITGFFADKSSGWHDDASILLERMADTIVTRGPDDFGMWTDKTFIGLAHRRLSILDLSDAGHQPMTCATGRFVIVFNGEIYNHLDLRSELNATRVGGILNEGWRGHSDTETLLAGFVEWGIKATIERCVGMFSFAVWDKKECVLTIGRDRLGEKPLYYGWQGLGNKSIFLFGSELKSIKAHPAFIPEINRDALCLLLKYGYIAAPYSIYRGIYKLQPGCFLSVSLKHPKPKIENYWCFSDIAVSGNKSPLVGSPEKMVNDLESLLKIAVRQQMVADVPLGAFLSGGIDSSLIVALMQSQSERPVKTFTIGFSESGYNEAEYAKGVARHLGTDHTELYVTSQQALNVIPKISSLYCEPFADSSQIPTYLVSGLARKQVAVSLSGDGGDELFAGYNRYVLAGNMWSKLLRLPYEARAFGAMSVRMLSPNTWSCLLRPMQLMMPNSFRQVNIGDKLYKAATVLCAKNIDDFYHRLITHWQPEDLVIDGSEPATCLNGMPIELPGLDDVQRMMALDTMTYLPDDILVKVDRATMGVSLEGRAPFLDHRVVEFAWRLPQSMKLRNGLGKWILREVLYRYVPKQLIDRPKMGFGVPIDIWLRGPLKEWAEALLDENRLRKEGYLNPGPIRKKWAEHLSGQRNWQYLLWNVLMFQAWLESQQLE